jgi:hypothetical protein
MSNLLLCCLILSLEFAYLLYYPVAVGSCPEFILSVENLRHLGIINIITRHAGRNVRPSGSLY